MILVSTLCFLELDFWYFLDRVMAWNSVLSPPAKHPVSMLTMFWACARECKEGLFSELPDFLI